LAILDYFYGKWPPCHKNFDEALIALSLMLKSHAAAYVSMHETSAKSPLLQTPQIGLAKAVTAFHPNTKSIRDRLAAARRNHFHNHSFIKSAIKGKVLIPGLHKENLITSNACDFIGLNYYFRQFISYDKTDPLKFGKVSSPKGHPGAGLTTDMGWEIYPEGLYETVRAFKKYNKPIMIAENGIATRDDKDRRSFIKNHLIQLLRAIKEGAPVFGYLHWSLMDNFEWAEGFTKRFGLIHVDFDTLKRTVKESAWYYAEVIRSGRP